MDKTQQLIDITDKITAKEKAAVDYIHNGEYEQAGNVIRELTALSQTAAQLKAEIQKEEISAADVQGLRSVQPARKSVQNMLQNEAAKTTKFEKLLGDEMGAKSPYEMRNSGNEWRNDDTKVVSVVEIQKRNIPDNLVELRKSNDIPRGTFVNRDTGMEIQFSRRSIEEIVAKAIPDDKREIPVEARMAALYQIKDLLENAICFDSQISEYDKETSKGKSPNSLFLHRMYALMTYNGEQYLANLAIEANYTKSNPNTIDGIANRVYSLRDTKITPVKLLGFDTHASPQKADTDTSQGVTTITIPQLYRFVKTYDAFFFENPEAPGRTDREAEIKLHSDFAEAVKTFGDEVSGGLSEPCNTKGTDFYETIKNMSEWADKVQEKAEKEKDKSKSNDGFEL